MAKARARGLIDLRFVDLRDFSDPPHFRVDDKPYGGGAGMVLKVEPIIRALRAICTKNEATRILVMSAKGRRYTQRTAQRLSRYDHLVLIAGRYEGIDQRVADFYADEEIRIGDYILMGGELAAGIIVESVARLLEKVVGNPESILHESFSDSMKREYAQYTRPPVFEGYEVPEVLRSGDHAKVAEWRRQEPGRSLTKSSKNSAGGSKQSLKTSKRVLIK